MDKQRLCFWIWWCVVFRNWNWTQKTGGWGYFVWMRKEKKSTSEYNFKLLRLVRDSCLRTGRWHLFILLYFNITITYMIFK